MARYKIDITKAVFKGWANGVRTWKDVDFTSIHVNAPNKYEADYKLNKLIPVDDGYQYFIEITTDNKKGKTDGKTVPNKESGKQKATTKVQKPKQKASSGSRKAAGKKARKS